MRLAFCDSCRSLESVRVDVNVDAGPFHRHREWRAFPFGIAYAVARGTQVSTVFFNDGTHRDYNSRAEPPHWGDA